MEENRKLRAIRRRDEGAMEWFIDCYAGYVNTIIYNTIGQYMTPSDVEEVSADVFFVLWENAKKVEYGKVKAYLSAVARNKAKEKLREIGKEIFLEEDCIIIADSNVEHEIVKKEQEQAVKQAIGEMNKQDQEIFLRHYYYYQSVMQISEETGMNPSTVKTRLRRGREQLKSILEKGGYGNGKENI